MSNQKKSVQTLVSEAKKALQSKGFSLAVLDQFTNEEIISLADKNAVQYSADTKSTSQAKGVQFRFLNYIKGVDNKRMSFEAVIDWLCADMSTDSKWFSSDFETVVSERQTSALMIALGKPGTFNEDLYKKMRLRAAQRINSHIVHDSDQNSTTNNTVNKYLKKADQNFRCKLVESAGVKIAVQLVDLPE